MAGRKTHQVHKDWPLTDQATDFTRPSGHNIQGWSQLEVCVWKQFFLRYAGHTDTEKVFLCATSCLSSLPSQSMFYFNFLRVFQRIVMSHMIFVNWHCQISMLLCQLWKFAATFTLLHINVVIKYFSNIWKKTCNTIQKLCSCSVFILTIRKKQLKH